MPTSEQTHAAVIVQSGLIADSCLQTLSPSRRQALRSRIAVLDALLADDGGYHDGENVVYLR